METKNSTGKTIQARLPNQHGEFQLHLFEEPGTGKEHLAMVMGDLASHSGPVLVRLHSECLTGEVFGSLRCDCQWQLQNGLGQIAQEKLGVLVYLRQEGRGIGLKAKLEAYNLQDQGLNTVEANLKLGFHVDHRDYGVAVDILKKLGIQQVRLITNNPLKANALIESGLDVVETVPSIAKPNKENERYLKTKADELGHSLP